MKDQLDVTCYLLLVLQPAERTPPQN